MTRHWSRTAGFTLVELLVVLGTIGLLLTVAASNRPSATGTRVAVAARSVASTLQVARSRAMATNGETVVYFDTVAGRFGIGSATTALPNGMNIAITVADTERQAEEGGVRFYPDGQSSGADILLTMNGREARLTVSWLTGEARFNR